MGFNRGNFFSALAGLIVGVMVVAVLPAGADDGDNLVLGANNTATQITKVTDRGGVLFRTTRIDTPAARFKVRSGPPIAVNSNVRVPALNADLLDGRHANTLSRAEYCADDDPADGTDYSCSMVITAPKRGLLLMSGSLDLWRTAAGGDLLHCRFTLDGNEVPGSERAMDLRVPENMEANCATDAGVEVDAGSHTVTLEMVSVAPDTRIAYVGAYVIYVPFDGQGNMP